MSRDELDESSVTMLDVLEQQTAAEEDAHAVLGGSDDAECTYAKGYVRRQALYACLSCCPEGSDTYAGICLACSLNCHEKHDLVELYTKRDFRCDCGGPKFAGRPCATGGVRAHNNDLNKYNHNFAGLYCKCERPYPDPERINDDDMIQCVVCEDWLHAGHLDARVPNHDRYSEMTCESCVEINSFLVDYASFSVNPDDEDSTLNETLDVTRPDDTLDASVPAIGDVASNIPELPKDKTTSVDDANENITNAPSAYDDVEMKTAREETEPTDFNMREENLGNTERIVAPDESSKSELNTTVESLENAEKILTPDESPKSGSNETVKNLDNIEQIDTPDKSSKLCSNKMVKNDDIAEKDSSIVKNDTFDNLPIPDISQTSSHFENSTVELNSAETGGIFKSNIDEKNDTIEQNLITDKTDVPNVKIDDSTLGQNLNEENLNDIFSDNLNEKKDEISTPFEMLEDHNATCDLNNAINSVQSFQTDNEKEDLVSESVFHTESKESFSSVTEKPSEADNSNKTENISSNTISSIPSTDAEKEESSSDSKDGAKSNEGASILCEKPIEADNIENDISIINEFSNHQSTEMEDFNKTDNSKTNHNGSNGEHSQNSVEGENIKEDIHLKRKVECDVVKMESCNDFAVKKQKLDHIKCTRPIRNSSVKHRGAIFWPCDWRSKLCSCLTCMEMYKEKNVSFLLDTEDTVIAYENLGKTKTSTSQYEKGLEALSSLDRIQQINAITEYNKMKEKLLEFLKTFKDKREVVREEDIKGFFAGMKPKREPDGVYFCR